MARAGARVALAPDRRHVLRVAADAVRNGLEDLGFAIEDTPSGARALYVTKR